MPMSPASTRAGMISSLAASPGWASTGTPPARREAPRGVDGNPRGGQALRHSVDPRPPLLALLTAESLEPRDVVVHRVPEDVNLAAVHVAVDLDAGNDLERRAPGRLVQRFGEPLGGGVVRHGEHPQPPAGRLPPPPPP